MYQFLFDIYTHTHIYIYRHTPYVCVCIHITIHIPYVYYTYNIFIALGPSLSSSVVGLITTDAWEIVSTWCDFTSLFALSLPILGHDFGLYASPDDSKQPYRSWLPLIFHRMRATPRLGHGHHVAILSTAWSSTSWFILVLDWMRCAFSRAGAVLS